MTNSDLDRLIPPEIKGDAFYKAIQKIAREENIKTVLEIGSSSGGGSTEAFVLGLRDNPHRPTLYCMEVSKSRFAELQRTYAADEFVKCYNTSSISLEKFPSQAEVIAFYQNQVTGLNHYPLDTVLDWLQKDIEYVQNSGVEDNGIRKIKQENDIKTFDVALIDGSEFTGTAELEEVYGAKFILLDDINTFKNSKNYQKLIHDPGYDLLENSVELRNGYAIFRRKVHSFATEQAEQNLVRNLVKSGMIVLDIGANVGDYTLLLSELVGSKGKVYGFEPTSTSTTFKRLSQAIESAELYNVTLVRKAVYSQDGSIEFNEFSEEYSVWNSIGKPQMLDPENALNRIPVVRTELVDAITLDTFCEENDIQKIDYLKLDVEGAESEALIGCTRLLSEHAIQFIQFEISQKMLEGLDKVAEETFQILGENDYECHRITPDGDIGERVTNSDAFYENYIAFPELPVHFFTIVLNGEPFIQYHIDIFKQLPFKWHWHIVEGVAELKHDTAWSTQLGGKVTDEIHCNGLSKDGTSEYLDDLAKQYSDQVTVYRKPNGEFWDGKREMVNIPLQNIQEECLLWQVDVDELWTVEQICDGRKLFIKNPDKTAAFYWCWYFVGENLVISTRNCYAQNPQQDWLRTWRYQPGAFWAAHEPPVLVETVAADQQRNIAAINPFFHDETEKEGLIFQHFAYVIPEQLKFKEQYYGYQNAVQQWNRLQLVNQFPVPLRDYFGWVGDHTMVDTATACGVSPIARRREEDWEFVEPLVLQKKVRKAPTILIDGVFFQLYQTGIARVWQSLLEEWAKADFSQHIVVLDRGGTAPKIPGIWYRQIPAYDYQQTDADREMLQQICDQEAADVFISTYYTTPVSTPSVFMAYDMIPEVLGADFNEPMWREKHYGINHASSYLAISQNTADDLVKCFPEISSDQVTVAHCGVSNHFFPANPQEIYQFRNKYGITKPYFVLVGVGSNYKNAELFFQAFSQLPSRQGFEMICTGSGYLLASEYRQFTSGTVVHALQLSDEELRLAYAGAIALIYPSRYEGFGLPIVEAMACGCPVITCPNASIPEVAGEAAIYVNDIDVMDMANALCEVQKPEVYNSLIAKGLEQAKKFSWSNMAEIASSALISATLLHLNLKEINLITFPDWSQNEEIIASDLSQLIRTATTYSNKDKTTLLIDTSHISNEDADLILSSVVMNLMMEEGLEVEESAEIVLIGKLSEIQWSLLRTFLAGRVVLQHENQEAIAQSKSENLTRIELSSL
ncbi:MAG: FkbM family methyltransferase [Oscillatoriales cyanobacterium RM2_1_1]|nr:FkbM family methyltransferase [Oscillatoriales cyanobacterium SM2_3_0]NJO46910.1 FkbM family methyltransferase [Oscillatoriales cyanobacterium RM2_1_1]